MSLADTVTKLSNARGALVDALNSKGAAMASSATLYECAEGIGSLTIGTDVSSTTAEASDVRSGKVFFTSGGVMTSGTIPDVSSATITPTTSDIVISSGGYLAGAQTIKGDANLTAANIASGVTIFGVTGTASGGADVTLGVVDSAGKFQAFSFSGTTPSDSGTAETVTNYKSWNSTLPAPVDPLTAQLLTRSGTSFTVPAGITALGNYALAYWATLTSVTLPAGLVSMGAGLFTNCTGLTSVTVPDSVTTIYNSVFYNCTGLTSVTLPANLTTLGNFAFTNCTSLTSIHIPAGVTAIGASAFSGCTNLTDIYCGFASGAVSGAPWGAPSATIHYAGE